jgi:Contractile injection system tube protein
MTLHKATLQEIATKPSPRPVPVPGTLITVQVNPTSLRLALTNNTDVGKSVGRPNTTFQGSSSSTLSFDMMMDTADQGTTSEPVDVQTLTAQLERFMLPKADEPKGIPPRVLFSYGSLQVAGVMSALNLEYDLFSSTGVPLRAKASVTIKEQLPQFDADLLGAGANTGSAATDPVPPGNVSAPGASAPSTPADRTGTALGGESAADFATRMGLDPSTWKTFAAGLSDPLSLDAGLQIDFSSSASASAGLGVQAGATATGAGADTADPTAPVGSLSPAALTAAGGVSAALAQQALSQSAVVAATARSAFAPPATAPAGDTAAAVTASAASSGYSPVPSFSPDPRAVSFGFGVPLRPLIPLPNRAAVALVHDVPRGQTWPPPGTLGGPAAPSAASGATTSGCGCGCGGGGES